MTRTGLALLQNKIGKILKKKYNEVQLKPFVQKSDASNDYR